MLPGLKTLIDPLSVNQFCEQYWQQQRYVARARRGLVQKLAKELEDFDVYRLLNRHSGPVQAWFTTLEGAFRAAEIPKAAAAAAYDAGVTLYLHQSGSPALSEWQASLARELGRFRGSLTCSIFAAKRGAGTRCHFDTLENFTIQLKGTKVWRLFPNRQIKAPLENWVTGREVTDEMNLYCDLPLLEDIPEEAETVELHPGDVLYLPRGYWHAAEASNDSVSMFLGFPVTPCVDLVLSALRSHLVRNELWRENFIDAASGPVWERKARGQMAELLRALQAEVAELTTDEVIGWGAEPASMNGGALLRRNPIATLRVHQPLEKRSGEALATVVIHQGAYSRERTLSIGRKLIPLCQWIAQQKSAFPLSEVKARSRNLSNEIVHNLLRHLCSYGLLHVCTDSEF